VERRTNQPGFDPLRVMGFALGLAVAATVVITSMIPAGAGVLGADVSVVAAPTGELALKRSGIVLRATGLTPSSDTATGELQLLNQTGGVQRVRLRGLADGPSLDQVLWISVTGPDGEQLYRGPLAGFEDWTATSVTLEPGVWRTFGLEAWLPPDAGPGYAGRMVQVDLAFRSTTEPAP
jgi:hypothetical protein